MGQVFAERTRPERAPYPVNDLRRSALHACAHAHNLVSMGLERLGIDTCGCLTQQGCCRRKRHVYGPQMGGRVGIATPTHVDTQCLTDRCRSPVPACGDAGAAMPEPGPFKVRICSADQLGRRSVECERRADNACHTHGMPCLGRAGHARCIEIERNQRSSVLPTRGHERVVHDACSRAPRLAASSAARRALDIVERKAESRRFRGPDGPDPAPVWWRHTKLHKNRQRVVMGFEHLRQTHVFRGKPSEPTPSCEGLA